MKARILSSGTYSVIAIEHEQGATNFISSTSSEMERSAAGFSALYDRYAERGKHGLSSNNFHLADVNSDIYEFIKGRLRVYGFMDGNRIIVLTNGAVKKDQKPDKHSIERCKKIRDDYFNAKANKTLIIDEDEQNENSTME